MVRRLPPDFVFQLRGHAFQAIDILCGRGLLVETLGDEDIERQIEARNSARRSGDFPAADRIRQELDQNGVILEDTKAGTRWKRK